MKIITVMSLIIVDNKIKRCSFLCCPEWLHWLSYKTQKRCLILCCPEWHHWWMYKTQKKCSILCWCTEWCHWLSCKTQKKVLDSLLSWLNHFLSESRVRLTSLEDDLKAILRSILTPSPCLVSYLSILDFKGWDGSEDGVGKAHWTRGSSENPPTITKHSQWETPYELPISRFPPALIQNLFPLSQDILQVELPCGDFVQSRQRQATNLEFVLQKIRWGMNVNPIQNITM